MERMKKPAGFFFMKETLAAAVFAVASYVSLNMAMSFLIYEPEVSPSRETRRAALL